ncbi:related to Pre-mRNA-processing protein 45 [Zygosaccharomyces bailii ISA1307]|nr:related to Pre-mRNA-processing protein 45 [Zygosaccharomyces bailii ISA1307]
MSFTSLLPSPKNSKEDAQRKTLLEQRSKDSAVKVLTHQSDEQESETSVFDSVVASNLNFQDFVPMRQRNFNLELPKPSQEEIENCYHRTKQVFDSILSKSTQPATAISKSTRQVHNSAYDVEVSAAGSQARKLVRITEHAKDPLQPNVIKAKKVVTPAVEEPATPIFHKTDSAEINKKLSKEEKDMWKIPPAISSWKNPNGYTIGLEKRLAMDGRYSKEQMQAHEINNGFEKLSTALEIADRKARQELKLRAEAKKQIALDESREKEEKLRLLAQKAREERSRLRNKRNYQSIENGGPEIDSAVHRAAIRKSRKEELERDSRRSKMSTADRLRELAYSQGREISEKVILGAAKSTDTQEVHYDSRLFSRGANAQAKRNEEQLYDSPLFLQQGANYRANLSKLDRIVEDHVSAKSTQIQPIQFTAEGDSEPKRNDKKYGLEKKEA